MFGHEHERKQVKRVPETRGRDAVRQHTPPPIIEQERSAVEARKREFVAVPWNVEVLDRLAMTRFDLGHAPDSITTHSNLPLCQFPLVSQCGNGMRPLRKRSSPALGTGGQAASGTGERVGTIGVMPMTPVEIGALLGVGLVAGLLGGLLGIGGSVIMIPTMVFLFHSRAWDNQHLYQGAAMIVNVVVAVPAMRRHQRAGAVPREYVRVFLPATMVFMAIGVGLSNLLGGEALRRVFALFLVYVVASTASKVFRKVADHTPEESLVTTPRSTAIGVATGTMGGLLGIGGGIVSVPLAQIISRMPLRNAIAASASTMVFSSTLGAALKVATLSGRGASWQQALILAATLAPTALIGGHLGAGLTHRVPVNVMRIVMSAVLAVMAARMLGVF